MTHALITGITGQDGSFLAELLLEKGYKVFGMARRESWYAPNNASHLADRIQILFGDMGEGTDIASALQLSKPDEIYNLAAQSRPGESWARPSETLLLNGLGAVRLFEGVKIHCPKARVYQASSSEMFGVQLPGSQNEDSPFNPLSPYAASKVYAHQMSKIYRDSYGLFIATGIAFNHESERRPHHFLSQKVAHGAACAALGIQDSPLLNEVGKPAVQSGKLALGCIDIARDWGYAGDFVWAMWRMLQEPHPTNLVLGTGVLHSLADLCKTAYQSVGCDWSKSVISDPSLVRPLESGQSLADPTRARKLLNWNPSTSFDAMIRKMVKAEICRLRGKSRAHAQSSQAAPPAPFPIPALIDSSEI
jgi:GDPmannose 4,6-dehydratase